MLGLFWSFRDVQMLYAFIGALFFPVLALALLIFNGRAQWVGKSFRNGVVSTVALLIVLVFFAYTALL
jgi:hypothetical protein